MYGNMNHFSVRKNGPGGGEDGEGEWGVSVSWGQSFSLGRWKIQEMDDGESCTTM